MKLLRAIRQFFDDVTEGPKISDPVFGDIYWDSYWWYVNCVFTPTGEEIGLSIVTDGAEPDERHHLLYFEIEKRYVLLRDSIADALFETLTEEFKRFKRNLISKCKREELWEHLRHEGIGIDDVNTQSCKWSVSYYCDWSDCIYDIHIEDWKVSEIENIGG